jgi:hypothetical protein
LNVVFSLILLKRFGIYGVALGTAAEIVLVKLLFLPIYVCRAADLPAKAYLFDALLGTLLKSAALLAVFYALVRGFILPSYGRLAACAAAQAALFAPAACFLVLTREERRTLRAIAGTVIKGAAAERAAEIQAAV